MDNAAASGMDVVRLDLLFQPLLQLPLVLSHAARLGLAVSVFNSPEPLAAAGLCGLTSSVEHRILELGGADFRNEVRRIFEPCRVLVEVDVRGLSR